MTRRFPPGRKATIDLIKSCAVHGVAIDSMEGAHRFRFVPAPARPLDDGPPSKRGSIACGKPKPRNITTWSPTRLDGSPMYFAPMTGEDDDLRKARAAWAQGNPQPLREYLAA